MLLSSYVSLYITHFVESKPTADCQPVNIGTILEVLRGDIIFYCVKNKTYICLLGNNVAHVFQCRKNGIHTNRDGHQNLKLLGINLNQVHLIGLVERNISLFKSSKSDIPLQSYGF